MVTYSLHVICQIDMVTLCIIRYFPKTSSTGQLLTKKLIPHFCYTGILSVGRFTSFENGVKTHIQYSTIP